MEENSQNENEVVIYAKCELVEEEKLWFLPTAFVQFILILRMSGDLFSFCEYVATQRSHFAYMTEEERVDEGIAFTIKWQDIRILRMWR